MNYSRGERWGSSPYTAKPNVNSQPRGRKGSVDGKFLRGNIRDMGNSGKPKRMLAEDRPGYPHVTVTWLIFLSLVLRTQEELDGHRPRGGSSVGK